MTQSQPDRLDRIEAILLQTATQQQANAEAIDSLRERFDSVGDRFDQVGNRLDQLGDRLNQVGNRLDQIAERQDRFQTQLEESIADLIQTIDYAVDQTEQLVRRFLEQSDNGHEL